jgi:hypothetical protein
MPSTPIAYNTGSPIDGTTQTGSLAVGSTAQPYCNDIGGVKWWMGPEEATGFVIGYPVPAGNHPTPIPGVSASVGFKRSKFKTNSSFLALTNRAFNQTFTNAPSASAWLTANGYWNTYSGSSGGNITIYTEWSVSSSLAGFLKIPSTDITIFNNTQYTYATGTLTSYTNPTSDVVAGGGVSPQVSSYLTGSVSVLNAVGVGFQIIPSGSSKSVTLKMYRNNTVVDTRTETLGPYLTPGLYSQFTALYLNGAVDDGDVFKFEFYS